MSEKLFITRFGNPVLRKATKKLSQAEISSEKTKTLINGMRDMLKNNEYGVALAAPQVGKSLALSVIGIKPTPTRPDVKPFETVIINPEILETYGEAVDMWEGCVSCGSDNDTLYAKVPRYKKIRLRWLDEKANKKEEIVEGFVAHVMQHEIDHMNGILFVDRVSDSSTFMMADEYRKRIKHQ